MDSLIHRMYFDRSTNRMIMPTEPLRSGALESDDAAQKSAHLRPNYDFDLLNSPENSSSPSLQRASFSPESSSSASPTFSANYFSDSECSPLFEDKVEFEPVYSPVMTTYSQQQSQPANPAVSLDTYEQLLHEYEQVDPDYEKEIQATLLDQWTGRRSHLYPSESANGIDLPPVAPFNGDQSLLLIDKSKAAESSCSFTPLTSPKCLFGNDADHQNEQNNELWLNYGSEQVAESWCHVESDDSESGEEEDSCYAAESEEAGSSGVVSESEDEAELFPPLPDRDEILFSHYASNYPVLKSVFGETDTPLSEFASDSDMDSDDNYEPLDEVHPQPVTGGHGQDPVEEQESGDTDNVEETVEPEDDSNHSDAKERACKRKALVLDDGDSEEEEESDSGYGYQPSSYQKRRKVSPKQMEKQPKKSSVALERRNKRKAPVRDYAEEEEEEEEESDDGFQSGPSQKRQKVAPKQTKKQQPKKKAPTKSRAHANNDKPYKCTFPGCSHSSSRRYNLTTHMKTHDTERVREFPCTEPGCSKAFDRKHDKDRHIETVHKGARAYRCKKCSAQFSRGDALARHMEKHEEEGDA